MIKTSHGFLKLFSDFCCLELDSDIDSDTDDTSDEDTSAANLCRLAENLLFTAVINPESQ